MKVLARIVSQVGETYSDLGISEVVNQGKFIF